MEQCGDSTSKQNQEMRQILSEFLAGVVKLEQLVEFGKRFLVSFQQALEFLIRPSINETSDLIQSILKQHETKRVKSYVEAGCVNASDSTVSVTQMSTSLSGLHDHLFEAHSILSELQTLINKAGNRLQSGPGDASDVSDLNYVKVSEQELSSNIKENPLHKVESLDASGCASFMAVIYGMVKQDYLMQERVVSSLGLKSSSAELGSYTLMWSLRPFVNEAIIHKANDWI